MPMKLAIWLAAAVAAAFAPSLSAQDRAAPDGPTKIRKVVLYKHGIGYFERRGTIAGNQVVTLGFKASQMKDLLTSLFAVDSRGKVEGISYDSKDPIEKQLENILIRIPQSNVLTELIGQLKGVRIEARVGTETVRGQIIGIEPVAQTSDSGTSTTYKLVVFADSQIRQLNLLELASLKILDEPLQKDLERILDIHLKSKYADRKEVKIAFAGEGSREAIVGYTIETPIWKTSYRILFEGDKPLMQGWAIVDNPTDEDWENVELTLVAGNPLSFVLDLYTPYYPARPHIGLETFRADRDRSGFASPPPAAAPGEPRGRREMDAERKALAKDKADESAQAGRLNLSELLARSLEPVVQGTPVGELFAYTAAAPVSVPRGKAALIPIVGQRVDGERALSFNPRSSSRVMNSFYFKNSTSLTLEAGPVTFFEASTSLGEGLLRRELKPSMREMIAYAIESGVTVEQVVKHDSRPIHRATLANGVLTVLYYQFRETEYKIHNQTDKEATLYLDHPKQPPFALVDQKADEELPDAWRLKIKLPAGKIASHVARERTEASSAVFILQTTPDQIRAYLSQPGISAKAREFLERVAKLKGEIADMQRSRQGLQAEHSQATQDEARYRANISALGATPKERELRERYLERMAQLDDRLGELRATIQDTDAKLREREASLAKLVAEFAE
jgi:hypothetical protein